MANSSKQIHPPSEKKTLWAWAFGTFFGAGLLQPGPGNVRLHCSCAALVWRRAHLPPLATHTCHRNHDRSRRQLRSSAFRASTIVARESGREDPGHVVVDEVAGQLIALIAITPDWRHAVISLLLFRIFDILKPPPVRQLERLPEGTGIMMDDVAAGILALLCAHLIQLFF